MIVSDAQFYQNELRRNHFKKNFFEIFGPPGGPPLGVPHISAPKSKFEKRLDSPKYFAKMSIHAKFEPIPTGSLFCEGYGFEKLPYHFLIRRFLYPLLDDMKAYPIVPVLLKIVGGTENIGEVGGKRVRAEL